MHSFYLVFSNTFETRHCISCNSYPNRYLALHQTSFRARCLNVKIHKRYTVRHSEHGLSRLPKLQSLKRMNVFLHKHIKVYNSYSNKIQKRYLKKMLYNWAQSAPVQHEKETASEILRTTFQSISTTWLCVWTLPQLRGDS